MTEHTGIETDLEQPAEERELDGLLADEATEEALANSPGGIRKLGDTELEGLSDGDGSVEISYLADPSLAPGSYRGFGPDWDEESPADPLDNGDDAAELGEDLELTSPDEDESTSLFALAGGFVGPRWERRATLVFDAPRAAELIREVRGLLVEDEEDVQAALHTVEGVADLLCAMPGAGERREAAMQAGAERDLDGILWLGIVEGPSLRFGLIVEDDGAIRLAAREREEAGGEQPAPVEEAPAEEEPEAFFGLATPVAAKMRGMAVEELAAEELVPTLLPEGTRPGRGIPEEAILLHEKRRAALLESRAPLTAASVASRIAAAVERHLGASGGAVSKASLYGSLTGFAPRRFVRATLTALGRAGLIRCASVRASETDRVKVVALAGASGAALKASVRKTTSLRRLERRHRADVADATRRGLRGKASRLLASGTPQAEASFWRTFELKDNRVDPKAAYAAPVVPFGGTSVAPHEREAVLELERSKAAARDAGRTETRVNRPGRLVAEKVEGVEAFYRVRRYERDTDLFCGPEGGASAAHCWPVSVTEVLHDPEDFFAGALAEEKTAASLVGARGRLASLLLADEGEEDYTDRLPEAERESGPEPMGAGARRRAFDAERHGEAVIGNRPSPGPSLTPGQRTAARRRVDRIVRSAGRQSAEKKSLEASLKARKKAWDAALSIHLASLPATDRLEMFLQLNGQREFASLEREASDAEGLKLAARELADAGRIKVRRGRSSGKVLIEATHALDREGLEEELLEVMADPTNGVEVPEGTGLAERVAAHKDALSRRASAEAKADPALQAVTAA